MHVALIEFRNSTPYPVQLANALGQICQVTLILPSSATHLASHVDREKVDLRSFDMPKLRQPSNLGMVWSMRDMIKLIGPDLVHITYWHIWGTPGLGMLETPPIVATVHDVTRHPGERGLWAVPSFMYELQWRWAEQVIVHANTAREILVTNHQRSPDSVHVIPIGVYDYYQDMAQAERPERPNTVLFFGRIWGYKGLEYLIEAEPYITQAIPDARIVIAGYSTDFKKYERAMVNPENFEVHNYRIPDDKVAGFFQSASIVALPYVEASQSGVVPIAYAFGKPVVATTVGGLPDVVVDGESGLLVPPADSRNLAEAIIALLRNKSLRHQMQKGALQLARTQLSWDHIAERTTKIYQAMML